MSNFHTHSYYSVRDGVQSPKLLDSVSNITVEDQKVPSFYFKKECEEILNIKFSRRGFRFYEFLRKSKYYGFEDPVSFSKKLIIYRDKYNKITSEDISVEDLFTKIGYWVRYGSIQDYLDKLEKQYLVLKILEEDRFDKHWWRDCKNAGYEDIIEWAEDRKKFVNSLTLKLGRKPSRSEIHNSLVRINANVNAKNNGFLNFVEYQASLNGFSISEYMANKNPNSHYYKFDKNGDIVEIDGVSFDEFIGRIKRLPIMFVPDSFHLINTGRTQESKYRNKILDNVLKGRKYKWFVYIKYDELGYPLVVGKSGSKLVNRSGCDVTFDKNPNGGPARQYLIKNNIDWNKTQIAISKSFETEKEAFEYEGKIIKKYKLLGS